MEKDEIRVLLREAAELANEVREEYRTEAFRIAAETLRGREVGTDDGTKQQGVPRTRPPGGTYTTAVNEVLALVHNRSHADKFEVVLHHALTTQGTESLPSDEILAAYQAARMAKPTNPSDIISKCSRRGHVTEAGRQDGHRTWRLTGMGQRYVQQLLDELSEQTGE